jgi:glycosyltransferase involved in cell wall biosynthesis
MGAAVSVCIPTFNGERYLEPCIESIVSQTFPDLEILAVDDHSSDHTFNILQTHAERDSRIRIVRNERNLGLVGNWNRCVELARGKWIKFVFQDDLIAPRCIEKMLAAARPGDSMAVCRRDFIFEGIPAKKRENFFDNVQSGSIEKIFPGRTRISSHEFREAALANFGRNFIGEPTAVMLRREVFKKYGHFNPNIIQKCDFEYWARIGVNEGFVYVPETLATFRLHPDAATMHNFHARYYWMDVLEPLILKHEFVYHPSFAPLRAFAKHRRPPLNLALDLARAAIWTRSLMMKTRDESSDAATPQVVEWKKAVKLYPKLERSLLIRMLILRRWLDRTFFWRFKKNESFPID